MLLFYIIIVHNLLLIDIIIDELVILSCWKQETCFGPRIDCSSRRSNRSVIVLWFSLYKSYNKEENEEQELDNLERDLAQIKAQINQVDPSLDDIKLVLEFSMTYAKKKILAYSKNFKNRTSIYSQNEDNSTTKTDWKEWTNTLRSLPKVWTKSETLPPTANRTSWISWVWAKSPSWNTRTSLVCSCKNSWWSSRLVDPSKRNSLLLKLSMPWDSKWSTSGPTDQNSWTDSLRPPGTGPCRRKANCLFTFLWWSRTELSRSTLKLTRKQSNKLKVDVCIFSATATAPHCRNDRTPASHDPTHGQTPTEPHGRYGRHGRNGRNGQHGRNSRGQSILTWLRWRSCLQWILREVNGTNWTT